MEKWRCISVVGIILGIAVIVIDSLVEGIPFVITIPLEAVAIILIFAGFIIKKTRRKTKSNTH